MYGPERVEDVLEKVAAGMNYSEISRITGVSRRTVGTWARGNVPTARDKWKALCVVCSDSFERLAVGPYGYLLGLYLGDGSIAEYPRAFRLRIVCCNAYPALVDECVMAMQDVLPSRVCLVPCAGCTEVSSYSKHWACLFPQHGEGPKHKRPIVLEDWQQSVVDRFPAPFIRGLIHSDRCRVLNHVNGTAYPRYHFTNVSSDIRGLFASACERLGIEWRQNNHKNLSVAKRATVRKLDEFIGPKS